MTPTDIATVRELIQYARATGWVHYIYGGSLGGEHLWRKPGSRVRYGTKVTWDDGYVQYFEPDRRLAKASLRPETATEVADWLRLLGLVPTVAQVAEAILTPDADVLPAGVPS